MVDYYQHMNTLKLFASKLRNDTTFDGMYDTPTFLMTQALLLYPDTEICDIPDVISMQVAEHNERGELLPEVAPTRVPGIHLAFGDMLTSLCTVNGLKKFGYLPQTPQLLRYVKGTLDAKLYAKCVANFRK